MCFYRSDKDNDTENRIKREKKKLGEARSQLEVTAEAICNAYAECVAEGSIERRNMVFSKPLSTRIAWDDKAQKVIDLSKRKRGSE